MKTKIKVAAVQAETVFLDIEATVEKAVTIIEEAAKNGAEVIGFPEAFLPGYPYWIWLGDPGYGMQFYKKLYANSFTIPGPIVSKLSEAARKNNVFLCMSGTEKDRGSLYLTQIWFDKSGNLLGKHRKLKPTGVERTIWGEGDGSMMPVFDTEVGRLGGLQCWEHLMPANHMAMDSLNEQIHVASWPAFAWDPAVIHHYDSARIITQFYAMSTGTYVILATETLSQDAIDMMCGDDEYKRTIYKAGQAASAQIINPAGKVISGELMAHDAEGIAYADIDLELIAEAKYHMDCAGHYSKPSVVSLIFDRRPHSPVDIIGEAPDYSIPYETLQDIK